METYTFITEFKGGTYVSQANASNKYEALNIWVEYPSVDMINSVFGDDTDHKWGNHLKSKINNGESVMSDVDGMKSVWYLQFLEGDDLVMVHVIYTCI